MPWLFADRREAGRRLADLLARGASDQGARSETVVVGMARGGLPVAAEVARVLGAALDVIVVRKVGYPGQPELGVGAIAEGGVMVLNEILIDDLGMRTSDVAAVVAHEQAELGRRVTRYRAGQAAIVVTGVDVILVDDGLATGYTARAAIAALRQGGSASVTLAVPVAAEATARELRSVADSVVVLETPAHLQNVGSFYLDFRQISDEEVVSILRGRAEDRPLER